MRRKVAIAMLLAAMLAGGSANLFGQGAGDLVTEGAFARWLVQVIGLARMLPAAPSDQECFASLMQNGIAPKAGWNTTNVVTMGNLARVVVQSMGRASEVENPDDDASYIKLLQTLGIQFGTVGEALNKLGPLDNPLGGGAQVVSTDPLKKQAKIRALDESQFGADMSTIQRTFAVALAPPPPPKKMTPH